MRHEKTDKLKSIQAMLANSFALVRLASQTTANQASSTLG